MTQTEQKTAAKEFAEYWKDKGDEKQGTQRYWIQLLDKVLGVRDAASCIEFEKKVQLKHTSFIDAYINSTKVLIEQKGSKINLAKSYEQSDSLVLTPYQQAKRYADELPYDLRPRWIVISNFTEIHIHDMNNPQAEPEVVMLENLEKEFYRLQFLVNIEDEHIKKETEVSLQAGELVGKLYNAILKQYKNPDSPESLKSLNILCVRLVFCLYAEDAGIFGKHGKFHDYLKQFNAKTARKALLELFKILDTAENDRDPYDETILSEFPYVNGGLFKDKNIEIPNLTDEIFDLLLDKASNDFDWSEISPTIFGAVFESTLNPDTRRTGGMHYTSIENIHKVIDPLFMDELTAEFNQIIELKIEKVRKDKLYDFQKKLANLKFLDPACGSGNFLTETYLSLRKLENKLLEQLLKGGQMLIGFDDNWKPINVSIGQFYGIEINDFAVTVAKTALWIAENQMIKETEKIVEKQLNFLPLKSYANIVEGNALQVDWESVVPKEKLSYIMGNPPFVGQSLRDNSQSDDMSIMFGKGSIETKLDYVICWYKKALDYINLSNKNTINVAFVSTNSICQGESVPTFWKRMVDNGAEIQFAHTSFIWNSEANEKAHVHCVIVGFTNKTTNKPKTLYSNETALKVNHINGYLKNAPDIWITNRTNIPNCNHPKMTTGSPPTDDGGLLLSNDEKVYFENKYPVLRKYIKPFIGAREFLHDKSGSFSRYCFWFVEASPSEYGNIKEIKERLEKVKALRLSSKADRIQKMAEYPYLFCQNRQPKTNYLVFPRHSSERRKYIPIGFVSPDIIAGDACSIIPDISMFEFGVLTSNVHNAWMKVVCGRLKSDFRYSPSTYNNFPWCDPTDEQKAKIEQTAQAILDARALYPDCSLADLYDELTMPPELRKAHIANDKTVMHAYGFTKDSNENQIVTELFKMYKNITG